MGFLDRRLAARTLPPVTIRASIAPQDGMGSNASTTPLTPPILSDGQTLKYNESRLVDHARFNDETDNENHNDEIINDLASLKNNFTEQLTDDEDEDSAPFSLESTNDANKQPLTPPIYHLPSPQDVFVPLPQTQRNQSQREQRLVEKEIECASLTEKILIVNTQTESNDHPKTSMSTKEREINPSKRKTKKSKSSGRNANKTSDSDENQAIAKEKKMICLDRLISLTPSF
ncbi:hypothetical protein TNCV_178171 [Trichonephila clavipes]|nr:hypothetical protein TNCV_178171 [Trichonephila clavipes]